MRRAAGWEDVAQWLSSSADPLGPRRSRARGRLSCRAPEERKTATSPEYAGRSGLRRVVVRAATRAACRVRGEPLHGRAPEGAGRGRLAACAVRHGGRLSAADPESDAAPRPLLHARDP